MCVCVCAYVFVHGPHVAVEHYNVHVYLLVENFFQGVYYRSIVATCQNLVLFEYIGTPYTRR